MTRRLALTACSSLLVSGALLTSCASSSSAEAETSPQAAPEPAPDATPAAAPEAAVASCALPPRHQGLIEELLAMWADVGPAVLGRPVSAAPRMVFVSATCSYDVGQGITEGESAVAFGDSKLPVAGREHGGQVLLPDGSKRPLSIYSFSSVHDQQPFFVLSLMDLWSQHPKAGALPNAADFILGVALHELAHTEQLPAAQKVFEALPVEDDKLDDKLIQTTFGGDEANVALYRKEADLLWEAATETDDEAAKTKAREALALVKARRAAWFTGDKAWMLDAEAVFMNLEGVGEWARLTTLLTAEERPPNPLLQEHEPKYQAFAQFKAMSREERVATIRKQTSKEWSQEEGLALMLLIDRFVPDWQGRIVADPPADPVALLDGI